MTFLSYITDNFAWLRPLSREIELLNLRWAQRDLQHKDPCHPDMGWIVLRINHLRGER